MTRERILAAALDLVGREGLGGLTTRKVAAAAGVNLGLVHYYFGTKEKLVGAVLGSFTDGFADIIGALDPADPLFETRLTGALSAALDNALSRPALLFALVGRILEVGFARISRGTPAKAAAGEARETAPAYAAPPAADEVPPPVDGLISLQRALALKLKAALAARGFDEAEATGRALRLFASIFHPLVLTDFSRLIYGYDFGDPAARADYVRAAVAQAFRS